MSENLTGFTFHLVPINYYKAQPEEQDYIPEPVAEGRENFIHCTNGYDNLVEAGNRYYVKDSRAYYAIVINLAKVKAPVKYEDPGKIFPHIYGALNREAIEEIRLVERDPAGFFLPSNYTGERKP